MLEIRGDDVPVIPLPDGVTTAGLNCLSSDISRHSQLGQMDVPKPAALHESGQILFAEIRSIHADRVLPNIRERLHTIRHQLVEQIFRPAPRIADRKEIRRTR
jgi:hypothetical protein